MVPRSISRVTDSAVKISMVMVRMVPTRPGTMLSWVDAGRVVARVRADLERRRGRCRGMARSCASAVCTTLAERAERGAGRDRIGGVGRDQHRRLVAAPQRRARNWRGISIANSTSPEAQQLVELGFVARQPRDLEVRGVLERREDRAADVARLLQQHRGRQIARRGVDGVAEQHELHQRDHDDHGERDAVAPELDELLDQHGAGLAPEPGAGRRRGACVGRHASLEVVPRLAHQVDEHVLERRLGLLPVRARRVAVAARSPPRAPPRRGRRRAGWCRTAPPCRCPACRRALRQAAAGGAARRVTT